VDRALNFLPHLIVKFHVVFFAAMLLNLRHDFRFAIATDLPFTVLRASGLCFVGAVVKH